MSNIKANPPINLAQLSPRLAASKGPSDEWLADEELQSLSIFAGLKKKIDFRKTPGATYLWHGTPGRVLFVQGDAGATAFYILATEEVLGLRRRQLALLRQFEQAGDDDETRKGSHLAGMSNKQLQELAARYEQQIASLESSRERREGEPELPALAVHVLPVDQQRVAAKTGWFRSLLRRARPAAPSGSVAQRYIPVDAPVAIDSQERFGALFAGDLFGEMSCMNRSPRSATVVVERDCYILEMARSAFESLRSDPQQKQKLDEIYRERLLGTFLQRLSLFAGLDPALIDPLVRVAELETHDAGALVFEQGDTADSVYIVRSGLAKVIENVGAKLRAEDFAPQYWDALRDEVATSASQPEAVRDYVANALGDNLRQALGSARAEGLPTAEGAAAAVDALNAFICQREVPKQFGKLARDAVQLVNSRELDQIARYFAEKVEDWSDVERRLYFRCVLEGAYPAGVPRRLNCCGPTRTLAYAGQGDVIGELGVVLDEPRHATCVAYDHPDGRIDMRVPDSRSGAVPSQLELVKIRRDDFTRVLQGSAELRERVKRIVDSRRPSAAAAAGPQQAEDWSLRNLPEFEDLGLVQGQRLMLIDLDRCTRCGECVKACVAAHDDGHTRLYLDGPRFGDYLAPISCRKCLDPVCMIGCPVGAIHRGDRGEIRIRDWCIGCSLCERQCPYGSIHMSELDGDLEVSTPLLELLEKEVELKEVKKRAVVCDLCASTNLGREACVYACPHDAAMRVDGMQFSFERIG